jgi:hypothetical protein
MNYFEKYLKYKAKYSELKKQIGGITSTIIKTTGANYVTVEGLPRGARTIYKDSLETFLKNNNHFVKSIYCPKEGICLVNFENVEIANKNLDNVRFLINKFNLSSGAVSSGVVSASAADSGVSYSRGVTPVTSSSIRYSGVVSAAAADSSVTSISVTPKKYYEPWADRNSKSLFIGLVVSPKTQVGKEIYRRLEELNMVKRTEIYSRYNKTTGEYRPEGFLVDPHLTLCTLSIPEGKLIDSVLDRDREWRTIVARIQMIVHSKIFSKRKQLYSKLGNYKVLGSWVVRDYTDDNVRMGDSRFNKRDFDDLLLSIINEILITSGISPDSTHRINDVRYAVAASPPKKNIPTFTHVCKIGSDNRSSYMAISSHTTDYKPHVSIANVNKINSDSIEDFVEEFKKAADSERASAISFLNLWSDSEQYRFYGNISHIYISYGGKNTYVAI